MEKIKNALPLIIYLDTQDYIQLFNEKEDGPIHRVFEKLYSFRDNGKILIGYSWAIIIEFITRPTNEFREERGRRGELLKKVCGNNAFPFLPDIKNGSKFPNDGNWLTNKGKKLITANWLRGQMQIAYIKAISEQKGINREQRRRFKNPSVMKKLFQEENTNWGMKREDFGEIPVSDEFIKSGILPRFMKGKCSDTELEEKINLFVSDPAEFSRIIYDYSNKPNLLDEFFGPVINKIENAFYLMQEATIKIEKLQSSIRSNRQSLIESGFDRIAAKRLTTPKKIKPIDPSEAVKKLNLYFGKGRADHIGHYIKKASQKGYHFKRSDIMDIMQMCYVLDCDLFRCDKAMAHLYQDYEPFSDKLVSKITDLPDRIDSILKLRNMN